jgi:hypothetical protein
MPFISLFPENDVACTSDGLYVPKGLQVVNCASFLPFTAVGVPQSFGPVVAETGSFTLTNPTTDRVMHCIVQINFGSVYLVMTGGGSAIVFDLFVMGVLGTLPSFPLGPTAQAGGYSASDFNTNPTSPFPDAKTRVGFPGRTVPRVLCPELNAGQSLEVKYQRNYQTNTPFASFHDFLFQSTTIQAWGLIV